MGTDGSLSRCTGWLAVGALVGLVGCTPDVGTGASEGEVSEQALLTMNQIARLAHDGFVWNSARYPVGSREWDANPCDRERISRMVAIAMAESGGNSTITGYNNDGSQDRGLWQFNNRAHSNIPNSCAYDAACSAREMARVSSNGRYCAPWTTYTGGAYLRWLDGARRAYDQGVPGCTSAPAPAPAPKNAQGCTSTQVTNCSRYGCGCVNGSCEGGYCPGDGCTTSQASACANYGCGCRLGKCSGGYCPR